MKRLATTLLTTGLCALGLSCSHRTGQGAPAVDAATRTATATVPATVPATAPVTAPATAPAVVAVGQGAPDFTLPSTEGRAIALAESRARGTVVVAFFPRAFTPG